MTLILAAFVSLFYGAANRLRGWSRGKRWAALIFLAAVTYCYAGWLGFDGWDLAAITVIAPAGFYLGRMKDGVRGTYLDKAVRGLFYAGIPVGFALVAWSWIPLVVILPFAILNGAIAWLCSKLPVPDSTIYAEPITGWVLGFLNLGALAFAIHHSIPSTIT